MAESQKLLLEVRNAVVGDRFAEATPFRCELWGQFPKDEAPAPIAQVSNAGTGGGHRFEIMSVGPYGSRLQRFYLAANYCMNRSLDMASFLDWALLDSYSDIAKVLGRELPQDTPLAGQCTVNDTIVDLVMTWAALDLNGTVYVAVPTLESLKSVERKPGTTTMHLEILQKQIQEKYPGSRVLNLMTPPYLLLPPA